MTDIYEGLLIRLGNTQGGMKYNVLLREQKEACCTLHITQTDAYLGTLGHFK